jgi:hypothetical protein
MAGLWLPFKAGVHNLGLKFLMSICISLPPVQTVPPEFAEKAIVKQKWWRRLSQL